VTSLQFIEYLCDLVRVRPVFTRTAFETKNYTKWHNSFYSKTQA